MFSQVTVPQRRTRYQRHDTWWHRAQYTAQLFTVSNMQIIYKCITNLRWLLGDDSMTKWQLFDMCAPPVKHSRGFQTMNQSLEREFKTKTRKTTRAKGCRELCLRQACKSIFGLAWAWPSTFDLFQPLAATQWAFIVICACHVWLLHWNKNEDTMNVEYTYHFWKCADAVCQKLSKLIHACWKYSLSKLVCF